MLGWKLFVRAVTLLIENLGDALRVSLLPYGIVIGLSALVTSNAPDDLAGMSYEEVFAAGDPAPGYVLLGLTNVVVSLWIAVSWHRYVLLDERPRGWLQAPRGGEMLGYLGRSILIGLLMIVAMLVVAIPLRIVVAAIPVLALFVGSLSLFVGTILFYRLGVVLPAGAIGHPITFGKAMEATRGHSGTAAILALLTVGFSLLLQLPSTLDGDVGLVSTIYQGVVGWIGLMIGVSVLTSLYGHLVEGRSVD